MGGLLPASPLLTAESPSEVEVAPPSFLELRATMPRPPKADGVEGAEEEEEEEEEVEVEGEPNIAETRPMSARGGFAPADDDDVDVDGDGSGEAGATVDFTVGTAFAALTLSGAARRSVQRFRASFDSFCSTSAVLLLGSSFSSFCRS